MRWILRLAAANRGIWKASELQRMLARGMVISAGKMSSLWSGHPNTLRLDELDVICAVLGCGVGELLLPEPGGPAASARRRRPAGRLTDAGELTRLSELFTPDVTYDLDDFGLGSLHGTAVMREAALALGDANLVGHHATNIVITRIDDRSARVQSKGIGIKADGTAGSVSYDDIVTRQPGGWKISYRKVAARRAPLGEKEAGAREVLERLRQAAISQSADEIRDGQIARLRDYANIVAAAAAMGRDR